MTNALPTAKSSVLNTFGLNVVRLRTELIGGDDTTVWKLT